MRDPKRIPEILGLLQKIWAYCPDLRLGQIIRNAIDVDDLFYIEDDKMIEGLKYFLKVCEGEHK